jgi:photosystem II stability/assembly factor-like uncharacterized protein
MMKIVITLIAFVPFNLTAQWEILNEGFKGSINTINFVNDNVGWIAGNNGTLLMTTDGGENWNSILINENWNIDKIDFVNESIGWAIGNVHTDPNWTYYIWKTSNGGDTWVQQSSSTAFGFNSLYVIDATNVFAVGGDKIYKSTNGGANWLNVSPTLQDRNYNSLWFQDSQTGVVVGFYNDGTADRGLILKTTNGGSTWNQTTVNEYNSITELQFLDNTKGYFRANNDSVSFLCKTEDMLLSWTVKTQHPYSIKSYQYLDNSNVYAIMADSLSSNNIMKSADEGGNWQKVQTISFEPLKIYFSSPDQGFVLSNLYIGRRTAGGVLYKSFENSDWRMNKFYYPLYDVSFINENKGFICGGYGLGHGNTGGIFVTDDGGITWKIKYDTWNIFRRFNFVNDIQGFSLACWGGIYETSDSGNSWNIIYENNIDSTGFEFYGNDICFKDESAIWAVGNYYTPDTSGAGILSTTDGGASWDLVWKFPNIPNYEYCLSSIHIKNNIGWSVGESGIIVKYAPQTGWVKQTPITDLPLNKVFFTDENHGWIAGGYQHYDGFQKILFKTTDGGANWNTVPNVPYFFRDIVFIDNNLGWAIGYDSSGVGGILETTDGGLTWSIDTGNLPAQLNALHIKDNYGWAVGDNGLILRTTDAGAVWVEDENDNSLPTEFTLEQNYPNPFNPSTTIKYSIPSITLRQAQSDIHVTLKVYDVLGREFVTLVNEEQPAGNYEVEFNSSSPIGAGSIRELASGIYFYQLKAGSFIRTKKMVIIK